MTTVRSTLGAATELFGKSGTGNAALADEVRDFVTHVFEGFPWRVVFTDWQGETYAVGKDEPHFSGKPLNIELKTPDAGRDILGLDGMRFLERFLAGEVELTGNLYALASVRMHTRLQLKPRHLLGRLARHVAFQDTERAQLNVKSHYDIPQEALNVYLDRVYMSYSCGMFEEPDRIERDELVRIGQGEQDDFDSLEKSMWRKFKDAADYIAPKEGETLLDVGCGYGGQLQVALANHPFGKVVGWTHSANQVREGEKLLEGFDRDRWELNEGDYRKDERVYDHITSTGMISHVGPRGLIPYVKNVRSRIKTGGRYLHHALMTRHFTLPIDFQLGIAFNKKYVWPGFHWFTLGEHVRALEKNGFQVERVQNLTRHYAKTTAAWYERMMANEDVMIENLGRPTFRAWQIFLAGITGAYLEKNIHVYRLYCEAT